jgi:hypothetical protein
MRRPLEIERRDIADSSDRNVKWKAAIGGLTSAATMPTSLN